MGSMLMKSAPGSSDPRPRPQLSSSAILPLMHWKLQSTLSTKSGLTDGNSKMVKLSSVDTMEQLHIQLSVVYQTTPWYRPHIQKVTSSATQVQLILVHHGKIMHQTTPKELVRPGSTNHVVLVVLQEKLQVLLIKTMLELRIPIVSKTRPPRDGSVSTSPVQLTPTPSRTPTTAPSEPSTLTPLPTTSTSLTSRPPTKRMPSPPSSHHQRSQPWSRDQELQPSQPLTPVLLIGQLPTKPRCWVLQPMHQPQTENNSSSETT